MKNFALQFLFQLLMCSAFAQPIIQWQTAFGGSELEESFSTQQTIDGGYIVAGYTSSNNGDVLGNHGGYDFWVTKFKQDGAVQWRKAYGGTNNDWAYAINQTSDGGFIAAGWSQSNSGDVNGNHGDKDAWLVKLDSVGGIEWQKSLGGSGWDEAWSVCQTQDGGYIMAGRSTSQNGDLTGNHGGLDYWVVKLNGIGVIQWQKSFGGTAEDNAYSVKQTTDGGYIIAGESLSTNGDVTGNHGDADYWILKLSSVGEIEWQKSLGGSSLDRGNDVVQTLDGGYAVVGQSSSNNGDITSPRGGYDIWVVKLNQAGSIEWQKSLGGSDQDRARSIQNAVGGGFVIGGATQSTDGDVAGNDGVLDMWVVKLKANGALQWQKTFGGTMAEVGNSIDLTYDGGYIISGLAWSDNGDVTGHHAKSDCWIVKLSAQSVEIEEPSMLSLGHLSLFPNPAQTALTLQVPAPDATDLQVVVADLLGRQVLHQSITNGSTLDVSRLPVGLYLIQALVESGKRYTGMFRKE